MMKTTFVLLSVALAALSASPVLAEQETTTIKHRDANGKTHVIKFYTTPLGNQCAYDETKDPSLYPCKEQGVCIRLNSTYGKCFTQAEATQIREQLDSSADGSDDSESDSASGSDDDSESASGSGSGSVEEVEFEEEEVGSGEEEDEGEGEEEEEEAEESS